MKSKKILFSLDEVKSVVETHLVPLLKTHKVFTFQGPLGAGKTTMIKTLLACCGVKEVVTSPTFSYVKQYHVVDEKCFYHFDLYRLTSLNSFLELGFDEYLNQENTVSVIEWPEVIGDLLLEEPLFSKVCAVTLDYVEGDLDSRSIQFEREL
ncbi:tRNA (adenosine(37)-N6)-threonylcarbamoyltransferase complex ATPase subunit type 1 TsaE [Candidatus Dependentiae bacterium]|nr:tRNA (adenosine(37)-N6)-threonylcarbamoyltransferase complex ATPase subunit type 1 TsaE [Candidatus Dependentiae bacterium]